jgi:hypothetical protein
MRSKNASPRVRVRHMWQLDRSNPDFGDRHFRDKATCLSRLISLASLRGICSSRNRREGCTEDRTMNAVFHKLKTVAALLLLNGER